MSITFRIYNDNDESVVEAFACYQCDACMQDPKTCTQPSVFKSSRWAMNVAQDKAALIINALGLTKGEPTPVGSINPNALLKAIERTPIDLLVRPTGVNNNIIHCGIDYDRAADYLTKLREIAREAARREDEVVWA